VTALSTQDSILLACLRARGACRAAELAGVLPWATATTVAAILGRLARSRWVTVTPGCPHRYEAASGYGRQVTIPGITERRS
jgi:hypothetical protein